MSKAFVQLGTKTEFIPIRSARIAIALFLVAAFLVACHSSNSSDDMGDSIPTATVDWSRDILTTNLQVEPSVVLHTN